MAAGSGGKGGSLPGVELAQSLPCQLACSPSTNQPSLPRLTTALQVWVATRPPQQTRRRQKAVAVAAAVRHGVRGGGASMPRWQPRTRSCTC